MIKRMDAPSEKTKNLSALSIVTAVFLCAITCLYTLGPTQSVQVLAQKRELPIYCVERSDNKIAISFDAAWGGAQTKKLLDILDEYEVKTTFFLVDIWVQRFPELVKEIAARGHEIGNHSTSHPQMSKLSEEKIREELRVMTAHVKELTGQDVTLFRPPYGDYNNRVITVSRAEGYEAIQWSVDSLDWKNRGKEDMVNNATRKIASGDIVLFHNDSQYILDALPEILADYQKKGLQIVKVSELLLDKETKINTQGRQVPVIPEV